MKIIVFVSVVLLLASCSSVHTSMLSYHQSERLKWQEQADAGEAEAQFQVGNSWCCSETKSFFNTQEALDWWCKAARQGHKAAQAQLAKYSTHEEQCAI